MFEACWGVVFEHYIMQCILRCKLRIRVYRNLQCVECIEYTRICVTQPIPTTCGLMSFQNSVTRWCQSIYRLPYPDITHSRVWSDTCGLTFFFFLKCRCCGTKWYVAEFVTLTSRNALQSYDSRIWEFATWVRETCIWSWWFLGDMRH